MDDPHRNQMIANHQRLFDFGEYSDFIIRYSDKEFAAHRSIICGWSPVLTKACNGSFKEAQEGAIDWSHRDPAVVDRFLSYLYTLDYDNMPPSSSIDSTVEEPNSAQHPGGEEEDEYSPQEPIGDLTDTGALLIARLSRLALNTDVYAMADEHQIPTLMQLAQLKFETDVRNLPLAALPDVISHVLDHTSPRDKGLREVCVKVCAEHIQEITGEDVGTAWDQLLRKDADFTFRVLHEGGHRLACQLESKSSELESKTAELERRSAAYKAVIALQPI